MNGRLDYTGQSVPSGQQLSADIRAKSEAAERVVEAARTLSRDSESWEELEDAIFAYDAITSPAPNTSEFTS